MLALLVAVSALTAVGFFTSRVSRAVDQQAGEVLAADLRMQSREPIDRAVFRAGARRGLADRRARDLSQRRLQRRRQRTDCDPRGFTRVSVARPAEGRRCAVRGRARSEHAAEPGRSMAGSAAHGAARRSGRRSHPRRLNRAHDHAGARLPARPGLAVRRSGADAADAARGHRRHRAHADGQPHLARRAVRRRLAGDRDSSSRNCWRARSPASASPTWPMRVRRSARPSIAPDAS